MPRRRPSAGLRSRVCLVAAVLAVVAAASGPATAQERSREADNRRCLNCHGQPHLAELSPRERAQMLAAGPVTQRSDAEDTRPGLYLGPDAFAAGSVHASLRCVDCHPDSERLPHGPDLAPAVCATACHASERIAFERSIHGDAAVRDTGMAPTCTTCHGGHNVLPPRDRDSLTHPLNIVRVCGDCHERHVAPIVEGRAPQEHIQAYLDSVHGKAVMSGGLVVAANCTDCHGHHEILPSADPASATHRDLIPRTCGRCHLGVVETYRTSIHGQLLEAGDERAPVCTDCHTAHAITRALTPGSVRDIVAECGECHDRPEMTGDRRSSFYHTYRASYHGQVNELGSTRAARCSDCHGAHDILPIADEGSRLHGENLIATCRSCHENAPAHFASFDPHADYLDGERYPLLNAVWWYFVILIGSAMGFYGLHSILWLVRSIIERSRRGPAPRPVANPHGIRRFTVLNRVNHGLLIITFFGLTITGLPLLFADQPWAQTMSRGIGGVHSLGLLHRLFAILLILNFVVHVIGLVRKAREHRGSFIRDWLTGPSTMLPTWKDFKDCAGMFRWFFRGGRKPAFDRWTYWEKFDYLAEIFGTLVIGGSGLMLWFPSLFSIVLPGWTFNVASIVHGYEALLAISFIFTIHFFNAHLRIEKFPVDDVIFTGQLAEEELRHERPEEYERLIATGEIESLRVPPAPAWQRRMAVFVGVVAMTIGFTIVALIILAGVELL